MTDHLHSELFSVVPVYNDISLNIYLIYPLQ